MKTNLKRVLSLVCALALCIGMLPMSAFAQEDAGTDQPVSATSNGITVNKRLTGDAETGYRIEMEAYASNTVTTSAGEATPLDIVLVLDTSGSMDEGFGEDGFAYYEVADHQDWSYNDIRDADQSYFVKVDGRHYEVSAESDGEWKYTGEDWSGWEWVESDYQIGYYTGSGRYRTFQQLGETSEDDPDAALWTGTLYTRRYEQADTKLEAMQAAVGDFIDTVKTEAQSQNADHKIGIISFASTADTEEDLTSVLSDAEALKDTVDALRANGGTQSDDGLDAAKRMLDGVSRESKKVVILFTDGEPGNYGFNDSVAASAVNTAEIHPRPSLPVDRAGPVVYTVNQLSNLII